MGEGFGAPVRRGLWGLLMLSILVVRMWMDAIPCHAGEMTFDLRPLQSLPSGSSASLEALGGTATNLWPTAIQTESGGLRFRAALDRPQYRLGEPIHLFVFVQNVTSNSVILPKCSGHEMLRIAAFDPEDRRVPPTDIGRWLDRLDAPDAMGWKQLGPDRILVLAAEVRDYVDFSQPGKFRVVPFLRFFSFRAPNGTPNCLALRPVNLELGPERAPNVQSLGSSGVSIGFREYQAVPRQKPQTALEHEAKLERETEALMRQMLLP